MSSPTNEIKARAKLPSMLFPYLIWSRYSFCCRPFFSVKQKYGDAYGRDFGLTKKPNVSK
jgi:hypothetical protein